MPSPKSGNDGSNSLPTSGPLKSSESRPYRSHKIPACDRCRKRKLRCAVEKPGEPCYSCHNSGVLCAYLQSSTKLKSSLEKISLPSANSRDDGCCSWTDRSSKRSRLDNHFVSEENSIVSPPHQPGFDNSSYVPRRSREDFQAESSASRSTIVVGPVLAEDVAMVEKHISGLDNYQASPSGHRYNTVSDNPQDPILYLTVPRRRQGLSINIGPGDAQREILEHMLGPLFSEVISSYFKYIHPAFPVLDEDSFIFLLKTQPKRVSAALVCDVVASSLIYWHRSPILRTHPCPDLRYIWNLAVAALQEEFLAPGMSTIHAALLDLGGRPTTSITGNTMNSGRAVALSNILGLNRDPSTWKISESEKNMRVRLWWGVLIHDRWSSFAHGVPAHVAKNQYDVHLPSIEELITPNLDNVGRLESAKCFLALCTLTEILGDILPLVYDRRQTAYSETSKLIRRLETELDEWEDSETVSSVFNERDSAILVSGSSSLKLGFLSAKMLLRRIAFRNTTVSSGYPSDMRQYSQAMLRESAHEVISLMCSLKSEHMSGFWLPYSAYHLASATIVLMRCAIETQDPLISERCKVSLTSFMTWLRQAKERDNWDLADICLSQCEAPILKMYSGSKGHRNHSKAQDTQAHPETGGDMIVSSARVTDGLDPGIFSFNDYCEGNFIGPSVTDTQHNVNGFEYPWADLWDMFQT